MSEKKKLRFEKDICSWTLLGAGSYSGTIPAIFPLTTHEVKSISLIVVSPRSQVNATF